MQKYYCDWLPAKNSILSDASRFNNRTEDKIENSVQNSLNFRHAVIILLLAWGDLAAVLANENYRFLANSDDLLDSHCIAELVCE